MTTQVSKKVRLVRCPRCLQVLPELPEVPLYRCGGCGTTLQAKNRKMETTGTELAPQEAVSVPKSQPDDVVEEKEARSSDHDLTSPPEVRSSSDKETIICRAEHGGTGVEICEDSCVSDGCSGLPEINSPLSDDSNIEVKKSLKLDASSGQNSKRYDKEFQNGEWAGGSDFSDELPSSGEYTNEDAVCAPQASEHEELHDDSCLHQEDLIDNQMESGESQRASCDGDNLADEVHLEAGSEDQENGLSPDGEDHRVRHDEKMKINCFHHENAVKTQNSLTDQNVEFHGGIYHAELDSSSGFASHDEENILKSADQSVKVNSAIAGLPNFRSPSTEDDVKASVADASGSPSKESLVSFYLSSPDDGHLDQEATRNLGRVGSVDTLRSSHLADHSSELNVTNGARSNYQTNGSYYVYDGSESSSDGTYDQISEHFSQPSAKSKDLGYLSTPERLGKVGFRVNDVVNSESERNCRAASSSDRAMKRSNWNQDKSSDINRYTSGNRMRLEKQGGFSRLPFTSRDPLPAHKTGSPSRYRHNLIPRHPGSHSSDKHSYTGPDRIDMLRAVCELKDQLSRMHIPEFRRFPAGVEEENVTPFIYNHWVREREIYDQLGRNDPWHNQTKACAGRHNPSRLAFSGEATHCLSHVGCSCLHCCPKDWRCATHSHSSHSKNGCSGVHMDRSCCNISSSLSPQHYASSELSLWGCEKKHRDAEIKRYNMVKKHVRPVAGGAPLVVCYHCSELLQLPADFLLIKKKYHQLMCNACGKVLKFSLLKRSHVVPYVPGASAPPPSEADYCNDATSQRNLEPPSQYNSCQHFEPVSCSDDYGQSFGRSCTTEGEASVKRNSYNRKMSSASSFDPVEDRKMKSILRESKDNNMNSMKMIESVGSSSKMPKWRKATSEIEELPPSSNSPLHRLMGYSSPSQVLKQKT